jgi:hypothetical protein
MSNLARRTRRLLGLGFLAAALLMLFAGQTVLRDRLHGYLFIVYWLSCLFLVALALVTALIDALVIRHQIRLQQLELIRTTLDPSHTPSPDTHRPSTPQSPGANG